MSSVSRWKGQPPLSRTTWAETKKPVPEMAQPVPICIREKFKKRASRKNHREYPAEIQLEA